MSFDVISVLALQLFISAAIAATVFLLVFNVVLALVEQVNVITTSQEGQS